MMTGMGGGGGGGGVMGGGGGGKRGVDWEACFSSWA